MPVTELTGMIPVMTPNAYCKQKAAQSGSSFYYSFLFLPTEKRLAMTALYAFCREVDDIVDSAKEINIAQQKIKWWSEEIDRLFENKAQHPITKALQPFIKLYNWDKQWFKDLLYGMRMDLEHRDYETFEELEQYCYYVAGIVGILSTHIFGFTDEKTLTFSKNLGIALQLINITRDLREDANRNRVYLPEQDLKTVGLSRSAILDQSAPLPALQQVLQMQADRARHYAKIAFDSLPESDRYAQVSGLMMSEIYFELLKSIEDSKFQVLTHRISLTPIRKLWIAWKTARREKKRYNQYQKQQLKAHATP
jgi:15-cis-phytoene synthase